MGKDRAAKAVRLATKQAQEARVTRHTRGNSVSTIVNNITVTGGIMLPDGMTVDEIVTATPNSKGGYDIRIEGSILGGVDDLHEWVENTVGLVLEQVKGALQEGESRIRESRIRDSGVPGHLPGHGRNRGEPDAADRGKHDPKPVRESRRAELAWGGKTSSPATPGTDD